MWSVSGEPLGDGGWIAAHLTSADVQLVEVDVSPAQYSEGHMPGASLRSEPPWRAGPELLLDVRAPAEYLGEPFWPSGASADAGEG